MNIKPQYYMFRAYLLCAFFQIIIFLFQWNFCFCKFIVLSSNYVFIISRVDTLEFNCVTTYILTKHSFQCIVNLQDQCDLSALFFLILAVLLFSMAWQAILWMLCWLSHPFLYFSTLQKWRNTCNAHKHRGIGRYITKH